MKKTIALLLCLAFLLPVLCACGNASKDNPTTDGGENTDPYHGLNYNGAAVNILYWDDAPMPEFDVEKPDDSNPRPVNDALFSRNKAVENALKVKLNYIPAHGDFNHLEEYVDKVKIAARSQNGDYDILAAYSRTLAQSAANGYAVDLLALSKGDSVLNFDNPWWSEKLLDTSLLGGKLLYASGDISSNLLYVMNCVFFNTDHIRDFQLEHPYDLVKANAWTQDKMFALAANRYEDLDDNKKKSENDVFGLALLHLNMDALFYGAGLQVVEYKDGYPTLGKEFMGEKCRDWIVMMVDAFMKSQDFWYDQNEADTPSRKIFGAGRATFLVDSPYCVDYTLNNYEDLEYGIVPCPKWDSAQTDYITGMSYSFSLYTIFAGSKNLVRAADVMECMAQKSYELVTPALFETTMKYQYALEDTASQMFDIIREGIVFDFGRTFSDSLLVHAAHTYRKKILASDTNWVSYIGRLAGGEEASLQAIVDLFKKNYK